MKFLILAAGMGTRMKYYTTTKPKGMLMFGGKTLIEHQLNCNNKNLFDKVIIVKGFKAETINYNGICYYTNNNYKSTNMIESLMKARKEFDDDIIVSYADIIFSKNVLHNLLQYNEDFVVTVDIDWQEYWRLRYGELNFDLESLCLDSEDCITKLGDIKPKIENIDGRYVGLLKFSKKGLKIIEEIYDSDEKWKKAFMTDILQEIIDRGYKVKAHIISKEWIEFDTSDDYRKARDWLENGVLEDNLKLKIKKE